GGDADAQRLGDRVEIDAARGRQAVVLHLEREGAQVRAVGVRGRRVDQLAGVDVGLQHEEAGIDHRLRDRANTRDRQRAAGGQRGDLDRVEGVRRRIVQVAEAEVNRVDRVSRVFV